MYSAVQFKLTKKLENTSLGKSNAFPVYVSAQSIFIQIERVEQAFFSGHKIVVFFKEIVVLLNQTGTSYGPRAKCGQKSMLMRATHKQYKYTETRL